MGTRRGFLMAFAFALLIGVSALAQGPPMEWDARRPPEIRALDISIGPTGAELPQEKARPRRARWSIARKDARDATARRG
jgi:hypothetical protein